jgi:GT2 family glycosyltransferase
MLSLFSDNIGQGANPLTLDTSALPLVSIIIPHYNGIEILSECLDSLKATTYPEIELLVVDNGSTDDSVDWVAKNHPDVRLIKNASNEGYAGGCNGGAQVAKGELLVFLNNDTVQEEGWIEPLVETLQSDSDVAAVQPKILNYFERDLFDYAGGSGGAMDLLCFPFARGRLFLTQEKDMGQYDDETDIFWASGSAFMVRRSDFEVAGRFDELFFAHQEEIDLQWRLHLMGRRSRVNPKSVVYHKNAVTLPAQSLNKQYLNHRNSMLMLLSNYSLPLMLYLFPIRLALEIVAIFYSLALVDFRHVFGILQSLIWILFRPHVILKRRRRVKSIRQLKDREVISRMYKGSVVLQYYIFKKRNYRDLVSSPD